MKTLDEIKTRIMESVKKILWTITCLVLTNFAIHAQGWEREYDYDIIPISDLRHLLDLGNDEHVLIGNSYPQLGALGNRIFLLKIDGNGDTLWLKTDPELNFKDLLGASLVDGGMVYATGSGSWPNERESQMTKVDMDGNHLWVQNYMGELAGDIVESDNGELIMVGRSNFNSSSYKDSIRVTRLDAQGNIIWHKKHFGPQSEKASRIVELPDGSLIIAGYNVIWNGTPASFILLKLDANGDLIWKNYFSDFDFTRSSSLMLTANNDLVVVGRKMIVRFDDLGNLLWMKTIDENINDVKELPNGNLALVSESYENDAYFNLHHLSAAGEENWMQSYIRPLVDLWDPLISCTSDNGFLIGTSGMVKVPEQDTFPILFKVDSLGEIYSSQLFGEVWNDENDDCLDTPDEMAMEGWIVAAANSENTFYSLVDEQGTYQIPVDTGAYIVSILEPFDYWEPCMDSILQQVLPADTIQIDFPMQGIVDCPLLSVDIATFNLVRCFSNTYYVDYCNYGTVTAEDAYVEINFDTDLEVDSASLMWSAVNGNTYTFDLGDIPINACGNFEIYTTLDPSCDSTILGETHCVEAHIFPDTFCLFDPMWDESSIEVNALCDGDSIRFQITNVGFEPMSEALDYIVIEDNVMREMGDFELGPGQTKEVPFLATGTTVRLEAEQAFGHPGISMPNVTVEGCDPDGDGLFSLGYFTQWPDDDASPQISIECLENVGSYDPNDKAAAPKGISENHYLAQDTDIEYKIRFQNIGTAAAMTVVVVDTLSPYLDISTLQLGASSHAYRFELLSNNVLKFTFDGINLPPESVNEAASQGFVKFRIGQIVDNPIGTMIYNSALIFFDNNEPILTNTTYHEVGENFINIILGDKNVFVPELIEAQPNPFSQSTLITVLENEHYRDYAIKIYNSLGQLIWQDTFSGTQYELNRNELTKGIYLLNITNEEQVIATGKVVVQ